MGSFMGELLVPKSGFPVLVDAVEVTVRLADADFVVSAWLVAVTVTFAVEVTDGAVRSPEFEMVPAEADQVTAVFAEPLTLAVYCAELPEDTVVFAGVIDTETVAAGPDTEMVHEAVAV